MAGKLRPSRRTPQPSRGPYADHDPAKRLEEACQGEVWDDSQTDGGAVGGWIGWFGFECGHAWEPWPWASANPDGFPDYAFSRYRRSLKWTSDGRMLLLWAELEGGPKGEQAEVLLECKEFLRLAATENQASGFLSDQEFIPPVPSETPSAYQKKVTQLRQWIGEGELFQANLSHAFRGPAPPQPRLFYQQIREHQPTEMSALLELDSDHTLMSWSPERFLSVNGNQLATFPIKGTAPRSDVEQIDQRFQQALATSSKERAELAMIVDMARHDLGRLAPPGGVSVLNEGEVKSFSTLHHRVAQVRAEWDSSQGLAALMRATFPPASVTGAPKVRALQAIVELEQEARGPYCGCFGYWLPGQPRGDFSVLIRTAMLSQNKISLRVGAGIVWDSQPELEWAETLLKAQYLIRGCDAAAR